MIPFVIFDPQSNLPPPPPDTTARYVGGLGGGGQGGGFPIHCISILKKRIQKAIPLISA